MDQNSQASIYTSLDPSTSQIRLLHLRPRRKQQVGADQDAPSLSADVDSEIECSLHVANTDDGNCQYEALSYEWGDAINNSLFIVVEGSKVQIRENLWWALWHLRDDEKIRVLWIDALCINQQDIRERNNQVKQMGWIYEHAEKVIAWIGLPDWDDLGEWVSELVGPMTLSTSIEQRKIDTASNLFD